MEKRKKTWIEGFVTGILAMLVCVAIGLFVIYGVTPFGGTKRLVNAEVVQKMNSIENLIDEKYLEEADKDFMQEGIYAGMVASLQDPYSVYITADDYQDYLNSAMGTYKGIGVIMRQNPETGEIMVDSCYPGSPGDKSGILPGDILVEMNGESLEGADIHEIAKEIRSMGEKEILLGVRRGEENLQFSLIPEEIIVPTLQHEMLDNNIGYMSIAEFTEGTPQQFQEAYQELNNKNMQGLIIDLRGNPGGLLQAVCDTLEQILPKGLIVYTMDKDGNKDEHTCKGETPIQIPLVLLVDENSASASEIFAGAVKDYQIGTIVGKTTFGKGIVQNSYQMNDGSAVKLTISKYYTPAGNYIHGKGIEPDIEVLQDQETEEDEQLNKGIEVLREKIS